MSGKNNSNNSSSQKILISAYSCKPGEVSEPGVAWKQIEALILKSKYEITIITRRKNVEPIRNALRALDCESVDVVGVDLPTGLLFWKKGHLAMHVYYYIWQLLAFFVAKKLDIKKCFDIAHHISFMTLRTNMVPFLRPKSIVGPVGGAQIPPSGFNKVLRHPVKECLRTASIFMMRISPVFRMFISKADVILLANRENMWIIPERYRCKCYIRQLGWSLKENKINYDADVEVPSETNMLKIYWGGRLIGWKGLELLLLSLKKVSDSGVLFKLDVSGKGPDEKYYHSLVKELGLNEKVTFHGWVDNNKVLELQCSSDIYVFTSLHETTGTALFEMMAIGKPMIVVDYAGPGEIVSKGGALRVSVEHGSDSSIEECARHIITLANDEDMRERLGREAKEQLRTIYSWDAYIIFIENLYDELIFGLPRKNSVPDNPPDA